MQKSWMGDIPNAHIRDHQRKRLYDAEDSCMFWGNAEVLTREQVEALIHKISQWAEIKPPEILEEGHHLVYATKDSISLPYPISKTLPYIAHEMAHVINYNGSNADHHGKNFAGTYLNVVKEFIGSTAHKELQHAFIKYKISFV